MLLSVIILVESIKKFNQSIFFCTFHIYRSTAVECNIKYALSKQSWRSGNAQVEYRSYKYLPNVLGTLDKMPTGFEV